MDDANSSVTSNVPAAEILVNVDLIQKKRKRTSKVSWLLFENKSLIMICCYSKWYIIFWPHNIQECLFLLNIDLIGSWWQFWPRSLQSVAQSFHWIILPPSLSSGGWKLQTLCFVFEPQCKYIEAVQIDNITSYVELCDYK